MNPYTPMQVRNEDHEIFKYLCEMQNIPQTAGFKLALECWLAELGLTRSEIQRRLYDKQRLHQTPSN